MRTRLASTGPHAGLLAALVFATISLTTAPASGQVATAAARVFGPAETSRPLADLAALTAEFNAGDWRPLQHRAMTILEAIGKEHAAVAEALDTRRHHVALLWIGADTFGKIMLMRVVVHSPIADDPSPDLPGVTELYEVMLSHSSSGQAASLYTSTRLNDPVAEALPAFVQAIAGPLFGAVSTLVGPERKAPTTLWATVSKVGLPFKRATVKLKSTARDPWLDPDAIAAGVQATAAKLTFAEVPNSPCARGHATAVAAALESAARNDCAASRSDLDACKQRLDAILTTRFAEQTCGRQARLKEETTALQLVDKRFREFVTASLASTAELELTFKNRPLTRFAFGAGSGVITNAHFTRPRVKLDGGVLTADPLNRVMTTAFVNISLKGYDAEAGRLAGAERVRVFVGAALTPDFGVVGGINVLMVRGIGITGGLAVFFAKGAEPADIGLPPADSADPYRLAVATAPFVGISYNYK